VNLIYNYTLFGIFVKADEALGTIGADAPIYTRLEILRCAQNDTRSEVLRFFDELRMSGRKGSQ
jgi:hypothetical protein